MKDDCGAEAKSSTQRTCVLPLNQFIVFSADSNTQLTHTYSGCVKACVCVCHNLLNALFWDRPYINICRSDHYYILLWLVYHFRPQLHRWRHLCIIASSAKHLHQMSDWMPGRTAAKSQQWPVSAAAFWGHQVVSSLLHAPKIRGIIWFGLFLPLYTAHSDLYSHPGS